MDKRSIEQKTSFVSALDISVRVLVVLYETAKRIDQVLDLVLLSLIICFSCLLKAESMNKHTNIKNWDVTWDLDI